MKGLQQTDDSSGWERLSLSYRPIRSFPQFDLHDIRSLQAAVDTTVTLLYARKRVYTTDRTSCATSNLWQRPADSVAVSAAASDTRILYNSGSGGPCRCERSLRDGQKLI